MYCYPTSRIIIIIIANEMLTIQFMCVFKYDKGFIYYCLTFY